MAVAVLDSLLDVEQTRNRDPANRFVTLALLVASQHQELFKRSYVRRVRHLTRRERVVSSNHYASVAAPSQAFHRASRPVLNLLPQAQQTAHFDTPLRKTLFSCFLFILF